MRTKRLIAVLITFAFFVSLCTSCDQTSTNTGISDETDRPNDSSNVFFDNSEMSKGSESVDSSADLSGESNEASDEETKLPQNEGKTVIEFLACPDNIIHPSVFYDALERAARNSGVEPDYSDLHNANYDFAQIYEYVGSAMKNADITYINQETLIGGTSGKIIGYPCFNSPVPVAETVIDLGVDVVNVAHNHMLDSGNTKYLENCNNIFESAGLEVIGYYPNKESTNNIRVIEREGIKVAFLAYTYGTNGISLPSSSKFVIPTLNEELITRQVALAKAQADIVIASCHWGYEDTFNANSEQKKYAKIFTELGVDVVLGMHPHVIQPMEWMTSESGSRTLVIYSLGNFVSGMVAGKNMLAGMFSMKIVKENDTGEVSIESPLFIPIVTHYTKKYGIASNDTGYRDFKIYYLSDYTEEIAKKHGVCIYERSHSATLIGGSFSRKALIKTLNQYIPNEFLPIEFHTEDTK